MPEAWSILYVSMWKVLLKQVTFMQELEKPAEEGLFHYNGMFYQMVSGYESHDGMFYRQCTHE